MSRLPFTPVPHHAIERAGSVLAHGAVLKLYSDAHLRRWRSVRVSLREMELQFGMSRSQLHRLLGDLEEIGLLSYEATRAGSVLTVFDPTKIHLAQGAEDEELVEDEGAGEDVSPGHLRGTPTRDTYAGHQSQGVTPDSGEAWDTYAGHLRGTPTRDTSRAREEMTARTETETNTESETEIDLQNTHSVASAQPAVPKAPPLRAPSPPEPTLPVEPKTDPAPPWAVKATRPKGVSALDLAGAVCRIADDILGTTAPMHRRGTAARPILALWRALGTPPLEDFERQARLVAEAARLCPDPLFARFVRAEGWQDSTDRSRSVNTLLRQDRWDERLRVAEAWAAHGRTTERAAPKVEAVPQRQGRRSIADMIADIDADEPATTSRSPFIDVESSPVHPQEKSC